MAIQENALNSALADALSEAGLSATPEWTSDLTKRKRIDVQAKEDNARQFYTAIECKIGQGSDRQSAAVRDAQRWLEDADCTNAIALCYPDSLKKSNTLSLRQRITESSEILMVRVDASGPIGPWRYGGIATLTRLIEDSVSDDTHVISAILRRAILTASAKFSTVTAREIADVLELPWDPDKNGLDPRPGRIACLIIANMALLQNRLDSEKIAINGLTSLIDALQSGNSQWALVQCWGAIYDVDYVPVVEPALAILRCLPSDFQTEVALETLIQAALNCVPHMRGLQLDHAGPVFHTLLQTAKYDGSYYTGTAAAILLSELAMPKDWQRVDGDWQDYSRLAKLKVCDPACGTGTLLMAAARTISDRYRQVEISPQAHEKLHLALVEKVLHGMDINRHAIHLAASMLTFSAPKIDYEKFNLFNMQHGVDENGDVRAGSLDILLDEAGYFPGFGPDITHSRLGPKGFAQEVPELDKSCDLVIMNPPFTRNDIRNRHLPDSERKAVQEREVDIANKTEVLAHRKAIHNASFGTYFIPIADKLLSDSGTLAVVLPFSACTGPSGRFVRNLLTDPERFQVELVITSHDNRRINFSENTTIHESLIIVRRPGNTRRPGRVAFVALSENPASASDAYLLANAIHNAMAGNRSLLSEFGNIGWQKIENLRDRPWTIACFYDHSLAFAFERIVELEAVEELTDLASVEPAGQGIRGSFAKVTQRQIPDMRALWHHKTSRQRTLETEADTFVLPKPTHEESAKKLWAKRSNLLIANRMRLNLVSTAATFSAQPLVGSAWIPVTPNGSNKEDTCKAWCVWFNSTPGLISFLALRAKQLTYPHFSMDTIRKLPTPNPEECNLGKLTDGFNRFGKKELLPLPQIAEDPVRKEIDQLVAATIPGLDLDEIAQWRDSIALEPSITDTKEPLKLN